MPFSKDQLMPGEKLIVLAHRHFLVLLKPILLNAVVLAALGWLSIVLHKAWPLLFFIFPLVFLLWEIAVRQNCEYILTDHRVVKQEGVFTTNSFDASLDKVNNVFHAQTFWGRLFNYGDVGLETASEQGTTVFHNVAGPVAFKNRIVHQREMYKSLADKLGGTRSQDDIPRLIENLASLRDRRIISDAEFEEKKRTLLGKI